MKPPRYASPATNPAGVAFPAIWALRCQFVLILVLAAWHGSTAEAAPEPASIFQPPPDTTLSSGPETFFWTAIDGASEYWLSIGSARGRTDYLNRTMRLNTSFVTSNELPTDGSTVWVTLWTRVGSAWYKREYSYTSASEGSAAVMVLPVENTTFTNTLGSETFYWSRGKRALRYFLEIGSTPLGKDILSRDMGTYRSHRAINLPTDGRALHVTLWTKLSTGWISRQYVYWAVTKPEEIAAEIEFPSPGSTLSDTTETFSWNAGSNASGYWISIGSKPGATDRVDQNTETSTSYTATNLPVDGSTLYVTLFTKFSSPTRWEQRRYTYQAALFTKEPAVILSPVENSTLSGRSETFTWSAGTRAVQYWLDIYLSTKPGLWQKIYNLDMGREREYVTDDNLPLDGRPIRAVLWTKFDDGKWVAREYLFTAAGVLPRASEIITPAPNTSLSGGSVTFEWLNTDGLRYWLDIGTSKGGTNLLTKGMGTSLSYTATNIPKDGRPLYLTLWTQVREPTGVTDSGWEKREFQYNQSATKAVIISPPNRATLTSGTTVVGTWSAGAGALAYRVQVGSAPGTDDYYDSGELSSSTLTLSEFIPLIDETVTAYVRLSTLLASGWVYNDYTYTVLPSN